jgi:pimeloyl-ACP methyl ester carboxylesterase
LTSRVPELIEGFKSPAYQDVSRGFMGNMAFLPTDDPHRKARIVEQMASAPQHVMASAFECTFSFDSAAAVSSCTAPALLINASPQDDVDRVRELCPHLMIGQTVGAGHFIQLEVPEQVNAMIDRFMQVSL